MCWTNPVTPGNTTRRGVGEQVRGPTKVPQYLLPQAGGSQDEDGGPDVFQQRPQVSAGVALKTAYHAGGGCGHLRRVPPNIGRVDYVGIQATGDGAFNPRGHPFTVDKVGAFSVMRVLEACGGGTGGKREQPFLVERGEPHGNGAADGLADQVGICPVPAGRRLGEGRWQSCR